MTTQANARAESFLKTFKVEEVYCNEYETFEQAAEVEHFIEVVYNERRARFFGYSVGRVEVWIPRQKRRPT